MKNSFDKLFVMLTVVVLSALVQGCGVNTVEPPSATLVSLSITPANTSIAPGTTTQFTATGIYSSGGTQNLTSLATWTSSDTGIATISNTAGSKGLATATASIGSTTISAVFSGITGTTTLSTSLVSSITVTPSSPSSIAPGTTQQFAASGTLLDSTVQNLTSFATWTSLNIPVATVSNTAGSKGLATAVTAPGTATIEATYSAITGSATLTSSHVASIVLFPAGASIAKGTTQQFTANGTLLDTSPQNLTTWATWTTSNAGVATISNTPGSQGRATAVALGTASIAATFDSIISSSATLTVTPAVLTSIAVTPASQSIALGLTQQFIATGTFSDLTTQDITSTATWHSSSTGIASINSSGLTTSVAQGTTTITASLSGKTSNSATLTVTPATLVSIAVSPASAVVSFSSGNTQQFIATGTFTDGSTQILTTSVTWASTNPAIPISNAPGTQGLATDTFFTVDSTSITASLSGKTSNTATLTFGP